jgi:hypothetical protein
MVDEIINFVWEKEIETIRPGDILKNSWGYDMTINDYCKVLENTGKTLKCVMIAKTVSNDDGLGHGRSVPDPDTEISTPFRLRITKRKNSPGFWYSGTYPYCKADKHYGTFFKCDGIPDYYNTWD